MRQQGVEIPKDPTTEKLAQKGGVLDHAEDFIYKYPTQLMNACYAMIGTEYVLDGLHKRKASVGKGPKNGTDLLYAGGLIIAGALAGLLIPQKNPDADHPPQGIVQKTTSWVQENPLRLTGILLTSNLAFLFKDAWRERAQNPAQKSYMFKLLAVAGFAFGNTLLALSSRSYGGGAKMDSESLNKMADAAGHVIAAQPKEVQDKLLEHISGFLATEPSVNMSAAQISELLHTRLAQIAVPALAQDWQSRVDKSGCTQCHSL